MQETFKKIQDDWFKKWNHRRFSAILVVCFLIWTPLLIAETLQIQHSCHPMIAFSKLPAECNPLVGLLPPPAIPVTSNLDAGTIGLAVGATAAILGAPVTIAAGLGILVWLATKTLF